MISPAGWCHYRVVLGRSASGVLEGRAERNSDPDRHPGICGDRPHITLADDRVVLRSTSTARVVQILRPGGRVDWGPPSSEARLQIGAVFEAIAREGDELQVARGGTGDIALALFRGDELQIAAGALRELDLRGAVAVEEDPRVNDEDVSGVTAWLAEPASEVVWVNADDGAERAVAAVSAARGSIFVIAIAGRDPVVRRQLSHRLAGPLTGRAQSRRFIDVDGRFTQREQWLDYVRNLPQTPPRDLWVKARVGEIAATLHEGESVFAAPWHLHLVRVGRRGLPGTLTQLAVVREHPALTRNLIVDSIEVIARGDMFLRK